MKARLIKQKRKLLLLLENGSTALASEEVLKQLFVSHKNLSAVRAKNGGWDGDYLKMEDVPGKTIAWVNDDNILCLKENPFMFMIQSVVDDEYITLHEYAVLHQKNDNRIKQLCRDGRIPGAQKKAGKWFVPKHAPYPEDARRTGVEK